MTRYFMHIRDGTNELLDPEGSEYSSLRAVREAAMLAVRDLIGGDVARGVLDLRSRVDAENAAGFVVYSLPFRDAVTIVADS